MHGEFQYKTTRFIWGVYLILMVALILSTSWSDGIQFLHFLLGGAISMFTFVATGTVWNWGEQPKGAAVQVNTTKSKDGDKLSRMLNRLSEEEVEQLREKLLDEAQYGLGDDGEIVMKRLK